MATPAKNNTVNHKRGTIALLGLDNDTEQKLRDALGEAYAFKIFESHEPLVSAIGVGSLKIDTLVIGTDAEDALDIALSVRGQLKHVQTIVLAEIRDVEALRRRAEIQSDDGDEIRVWPSQHLGDLPDEIKKAIKRAHRRVRREDDDESEQDRGQGSRRAEAREHLERLLEHAPIGMVTINNAGEVVALNRQARTIIGVDRGHLINRRIHDFFPVYEQKKLRAILNNNDTDGQNGLPRVLRIGEEEEGRRHVEVIVAGEVGRNGGTCTMLILHDVSSIVRAELAQKRAAAALQASEDRFHELADLMRLVPWEMAVDGIRLTYIGERIEDILGYPRSRWYGAEFFVERIPTDERERVVETHRRNIRRLQNFEVEFRMTTADGGVRWLRNVVNVVRNDAGQPVKIRGFLIDVTEQKEREAGNPRGS